MTTRLDSSGKGSIHPTTVNGKQRRIGIIKSIKVAPGPVEIGLLYQIVVFGGLLSGDDIVKFDAKPGNEYVIKSIRLNENRAFRFAVIDSETNEDILAVTNKGSE